MLCYYSVPFFYSVLNLPVEYKKIELSVIDITLAGYGATKRLFFIPEFLQDRD